MAAKSKKRLSVIENKLLKLDKLQLHDVLCSICNSILIEPVTLPCFHDFCLTCFNGTVENNALCCPLCRLRIGSWLRTSTKHKNLINASLWNFIKNKFQKEVHSKLKGEELPLPEEKIVIRLSAPGEIRLEYEAELQRLRTERLKLEEKHLHETETLAKKLQEDELKAHNQYLERIKEDELLAKQLQGKNITHGSNGIKVTPSKGTNRCRLKPTKIDSYLCKTSDYSTTRKQKSEKNTNDSTEASDLTRIDCNQISPELVPSYGTFVKKFIDKKIRSVTSLWNKDNGKNNSHRGTFLLNNKDQSSLKSEVTNNPKASGSGVQSLPVSLPYTGFLNKKHPEPQQTETDSVDSMRQELCYFKPIEGMTPTCFKPSNGLPIRVLSQRATCLSYTSLSQAAPTKAQYLENLCRLRSISLSKNLPSAFVLALKILQVKQETPTKSDRITRNKVTKPLATSISNGSTLIERKYTTCIRNKNNLSVDGVTKLETEKTLRRTRSIGSLPKINETTPKKAKVRERKAISERKPYLRSDSRKVDCIRKSVDSAIVPEPIQIDHKVNLVMKNLSSPCCNVKKILEEQLQIEKMIEQEKKDLELARQVQAEWNGQRPARRASRKRPLAAHTLRPPKKLRA